jgi:hypothetical protein
MSSILDMPAPTNPIVEGTVPAPPPSQTSRTTEGTQPQVDACEPDAWRDTTQRVELRCEGANTEVERHDEGWVLDQSCLALGVFNYSCTYIRTVGLPPLT